jgi:hypothetical protein
MIKEENAAVLDYKLVTRKNAERNNKRHFHPRAMFLVACSTVAICVSSKRLITIYKLIHFSFPAISSSWK